MDRAAVLEDQRGEIAHPPLAHILEATVPATAAAKQRRDRDDVNGFVNVTRPIKTSQHLTGP